MNPHNPLPPDHPIIGELKLRLGVDDQPTLQIEVKIDPHAQPLCCFDNVKQNNAMYGTTPKYGWLLWEEHGLIAIAQAHAVVEHRRQIIDITPYVLSNARQRTFVIDPRMEHSDIKICGVSLPIDKTNKHHCELAKIAQLKDEITTKYFGQKLTRKEAARIKRTDLKNLPHTVKEALIREIKKYQ
jgi:hypothetical protein